MTELVTISFEGSIALPIEYLDEVLGDAAQAVQNALGYGVVSVVSAEADHVDDDEDLSLDDLAEREDDEVDRRWPDDA